MSAGTWGPARQLAEVRTADLGQPGVVFSHDHYLYRTTGRALGQGGMGQVVVLDRIAEADLGDPDERPEPVVGKTFHAQYLYQLRTDEVTRRDHETNLGAIRRLQRLDHPHILPTYVAASIADNHLSVTPLKQHTLLELVSQNALTPRQRVERLMQALSGLRALHENRIVHRDLTLRNILVDGSSGAGPGAAYLFDFDLALSLDDIGPTSYKRHYQGRIFGSPGYSVAPEILDPALMDSAITPRLDVYAIGGALFSLFTDQHVYGDTEDMWGLLVRISEGVVVGGVSRIDYPKTVPACLRPIIETCLERDPGNRYGSVTLVLGELERCLEKLDGAAREDTFHRVTAVGAKVDSRSRVESVHATRRDETLTKAVIEIVDRALGRFGYQVQRALGRVKGFPIFMATPSPDLLASGQFPDVNTYPKIVTAMNLAQVPDGPALVERWMTRFVPALTAARQGLLTALHKVVHDEWSNHLLLFSEFVDGARFGTDLDDLELELAEALGLAFLAVRQVGRLHEQGVAHNNVRPQALLLKGLKVTREVQPAMVGLVDPSLDPVAMTNDVRNLAHLVHAWLRPGQVESLDPQRRQLIEGLKARLQAMAYDESAAPPGIDELIAHVANGLAAIDANFQVLRRHGGDLRDYVLLLVSHRLYPKLWP